MFVGNEKTQMFALFFATILAWSSFFSVIFFTNPQSAGKLGVIILYSSSILGLASLLMILCQIVKIRHLFGGKK